MNSEIVNVDEIEEIIIAYANGDLSRRLDISDNRDDRDTIIAGINMLGEELERTMISRDYFMNIYNSVSEILLFLNVEGKITGLNHAAERVLNKTLSDLMGSELKSIISDRFLQIENDIRSAIMLGEHYLSFEAALKTSNSNEIPISCTLSRVVDKFNSLNGYLFIAKDITEQKNKEINDLRIAISSQEKERKRLAYDLHDSLGQELNAVKMYINSLVLMDTSSETFIETFESCKSILDNSLDTIRNISFDLMPKALEHGGLIQAISEFVKRLSLIAEIEYNFPKLKIYLSPESQINLFRIIQEFVNNSLKHANRSKIKIHLIRRKKNIILSITDYGKGFKMSEKKDGNGIFNIKTRLHALNAEYNFGSDINKGTYLKLLIEDK
ncbi:MAG: histidine kinase [Bacteroidota bacterium]|nr:histidine kinase [Bacteroidota bacterium]